ncbi:hypothetical protein D3C80_1966980 [compost metagenome]
MGLDGEAIVVLARWNHQFAVQAAFGFRQQADEGLFQAGAGGALQQFGRGAGGEDAPIVHRHQMVEALRLVHVGGGHQHAHLRALGADAFDQLPELVA